MRHTLHTLRRLLAASLLVARPSKVWRAIVLLLFVPCMLFWMAPVSARTVLDLDESRQPIALQDWGDWLVDKTGVLTVNEVAKLPAHQFEATAPQKIHHLEAKEALWIRFSVPAAPDNERWYVTLPHAGIDSVNLYTRGSDALWTSRKAGDSVPVANWPIPHLYPVFALAVSAEEPTYYALRIEASSSFSAPVWFENESGFSTTLQTKSVIYGIYFGLLMMVSIFAFITAITMRDVGHAFFGLWVAISTLAIASNAGIGGLHLWPHVAAWNDVAEYVLPVLSLAPLLVFVALSISLKARKPRIYGAFMLSAVAMACLAYAMTMVPSTTRTHVALAICAVGGALCVAVMVWAISIGDRFAAWLLLGFTPLTALLSLPLVYVLQWIPPNLISQQIGMVAVGITMPTIFLMLVLRSQERRHYQQRISKINRIDPATGLVNDMVFMHRLQRQIERSARLNHQSLVVVIDITNRSKILQDFGRRITLELILRLAQRLTVFVRDVDTVARLGEARFGLLIDGPVPQSKVTSMATKIMARFVDPFGGLPHALNTRPKIALALVPLETGTAEEIMANLDALLMDATPDNKKNIFMTSDYSTKGEIHA